MDSPDTLTPYRTVLCVLLQSYVNPDASLSLDSLSYEGRHKLATFLHQQMRSCDSFLEPSLEEVCSKLSTSLGIEEGQIFAEKLRMHMAGFQTPDDVNSLFLNLPDTLSSLPLDPEASEDDDRLYIKPKSILGLFIRRCILAYNVMSFEATCRLLVNIQSYANIGTETFATSASLTSEDSMNDEAMMGPALPDKWSDYLDIEDPETWLDHGVGSMEPDSAVPASPDGSQELNALSLSGERMFSPPKKLKFSRSLPQIEAYLANQAADIQKDMADLSFSEVDSRLQELESLSTGCPKIHYLKYLNFLRIRDYTSALDSLHRYFDYRQSTISNTAGDPRLGRFQAGLVTLGILHCRLGHHAESYKALNEAIRVAQQGNDDYCLAYALGGLCGLLLDASASFHSPPAVHGGLSEESVLSLLKQCLSKAMELKLLHLTAFARLSLAKYEMQHAQRLPSASTGSESPSSSGSSPLQVLETLRLGSHLHSEAMSSIAIDLLLPPSGLLSLGSHNFRASLAVSASVAAGTSIPFSATCHPVHGGALPSSPSQQSAISSPILQLAGASHVLKASAWEIYGSAAMARISALTHASCYADIASSDDLCSAFVTMAASLSFSKGYQVAVTALEGMAAMFPPPVPLRLQIAIADLSHTLALNRGHLLQADSLCLDLESMLFSSAKDDSAVAVGVGMKRVRTLLAQKEAPQALVLLKRLFVACLQKDLQIPRVSLLLLFGEAHMTAGCPATALPYILSAATLSQVLSLGILEAQATVSLAEAWLLLDAAHAAKAVLLLESCWDLILSHGGVEIESRASTVLAKCLISNTAAKGGVDSLPLRQALVHLQTAARGFREMEMKQSQMEVQYLLSLVHNTCGDTEQREAAARTFCSLYSSLDD